MIAIVDFGVGNIGSINNMLKKINAGEVIMASTSEDIKEADKYILPGVGAFDTGMKLLNSSGLRNELDIQVLSNNKPILGICLGMQMLGKASDEGKEPGLGYIDFESHKFILNDTNLRIPHMGWNYVDIKRDNPLAVNRKDNLRFYFVHSYYALCENEENVIFTCNYGVEFAAGVYKGNVYGVQFHPEKSHSYGLWLMKNFLKEV